MEYAEVGKTSRQLLASGKIKEAIDILQNYVKNTKKIKEDYADEVIIISSRYNALQKSLLKGTISYSESSIEKNRITKDLLDLIGHLHKAVPEKDRQIKIEGSKNVVIGSKINVAGDFYIGDEIKSDEKIVERLLQENSKIRILFLASNPLDTNPLRLDKEMRDIETELIRSKNRDSFEFIKFSAVRIKDLQDALLNYAPNFVHFSGHGNTDGISLLDNRTDETQIVQSEPLANLFRLFSNDVACVFLNSCFSKEQASLIKRFIPNVIGMSKAVPDDTAIEFATVFYKGIGAGKEIGFSFELAKNSIDLNNISGSDIPIYL